ncbi:hypothetical protein ACK2J6_001219 [Vibrio fluvialis]
MQFGLSNDRKRFRRFLMDGTYTRHFAWLPVRLSYSKKLIWLNSYCRFYTAGRRFTELGYTVMLSPEAHILPTTFSSKCLIAAKRMW